jgi:hypothetical protein
LSVFTGIDGLQRALFTGAAAFFGCVAVGVTAARVGLGPAAACAGLVVAAVVVIRTTTRFRLTIGDDLLLVRTVAGVPYARLRYLLDHEVTLYEAFEDDVAESVALRAPSSPFGPHVEEELFGPYSWGTDRAVLPEMFDLQRAALEALGAARARVPPRAPGFWIGGHRVAEREIEAHHPSGRVARVKLQRDRHLMGLDLPAGTVLYTNLGAPQEWVHPDRPDRIDEVEAPSGLPVPGGLRSAPGARVSIDALARVRRASAVAVFGETRFNAPQTRPTLARQTRPTRGSRSGSQRWPGPRSLRPAG